MDKVIGIVGGVGSYAGIDLIKKIYHHSGARSDQEHLPISMLSLPHKILDRSSFLLGEIIENPAFKINEVISTLCLNGAQIIGIPCNTAHVPKIFEEIKKSIPPGCQLINLIEEVAKYIKLNYPSIKKVGVLSTNGTYQSNVYPKILATYSIEVVQPSEDIQKMFVHPAIYDSQYGIKSYSNPVNKKAKDDLMVAVSYLSKRGAKAIILGCTEIPLAINENDVGDVLFIDATSVLAKALIRGSKGISQSHSS